MIQMSFDFELVPLVRSVKTKVIASECDGIEVTIRVSGKIIIAVVPDWVFGRGLSFMRGWLKAGRQ